MATKEATYENTVRRIKKPNGKEFLYAWRDGGPPIPGPYGSDESRAAWHAKMAERNALPAPAAEKISDLIVLFKAQPRWQGTASDAKNYAQATKDSYSIYLDRIEAKLGGTTLAAFDRKEIRAVITAWRDKEFAGQNRTADYAVAVLRALLSFGIRLGKLDSNQAMHMESIHEVDRSELIWEPAHIAALEASATEAMVRAGKLASLSGIRQADLLRLKWGSVLPDRIEFLTQKSKFRNWARIPMHDELRKFLETIVETADRDPSDFVLKTERGNRPWGSGFKSSWQKATAKAAKDHPALAEKLNDLHFHDLRGTAITRFAIAGFQPFEIAEFVGWKESAVTALLKRYVSDSALWEARAKRLAEPSPPAPVSPAANENAGKLETVLETVAGNPFPETAVV